MHSGIVRLRGIHAEYRKHTTAKNPAEAAKVEELAEKIDKSFEKLEALSE